MTTSKRELDRVRGLLLGWPGNREGELGEAPDSWLEESMVERGAWIDGDWIVVPDTERDVPPRTRKKRAG